MITLIVVCILVAVAALALLPAALWVIGMWWLAVREAWRDIRDA